jgi:uncharacterized protein (DUF58 family)
VKPHAAAVVPAPADAGALVQQVRRLELRTRRLVDSRFSGEYHSVFKGQGIEFAEVREYMPGDDVRTIDWNVTARLGAPYIKKFVEERELSVMLAVDLSGSQRWGTSARFKSETAAEVAATLALSAARNNDRIGLVAFTDRVEHAVPPRKGRRHVLRLLRDLLALQPKGVTTSPESGLEHVERITANRLVLFLFSDFQFGEGWPAFERALTRAALRHDVVPVHLTDDREVRLPPLGLLRVRDPETGGVSVVDASAPGPSARFAALAAAERGRAERLFRRLGVDSIWLRTGEPYAKPLVEFFSRRERRLRR